MRHAGRTSIVAFVATFLSLGSLYGQAAGSRPLETFDAQGRMLSRMILNSDQSAQRTSYAYGPQGVKPSQTIDEWVDATGRLTRRVIEHFDSTGRLMERRDVRVDPAGHESGTLTKFSYDGSGARGQTVRSLP
jgi:hypothetical protein